MVDLEEERKCKEGNPPFPPKKKPQQNNPKKPQQKHNNPYMENYKMGLL